MVLEEMSNLEQKDHVYDTMVVNSERITIFELRST